jgi:hypothetical protein
MTAQNPQSAPYGVGYRKPPRHTQFQKGRSGNPGGRPRRAPEGRLKELTLQEVYRGVVVKRPDGIAEPELAIQAILRSQVELAMNGNVRAQRDILNAVRAYEREDAEAAALQAEKDAATPEAKKMSINEAARRIALLFRMAMAEREAAAGEAAASETAASDTAPGEACAAAKETAANDGDPERQAAPPADGVQQPADGAAPDSSPVTSPADRRPRRSRPARCARPAQEAPSASNDSRAGLLNNRLPRTRRLHHRTGSPPSFNMTWKSAPPFNVTWEDVMSRHGARQKFGNSLLNSLFSGNRTAARDETRANARVPRQRLIGAKRAGSIRLFCCDTR